MRSMPLGVLKSAVGMPWRTTLCHGSSFWADLNWIICSQIDCFSRRNWAEKVLVVVITTFWPRVLETVATTGPLTPLSEKALLNAFRIASGEKSFDEVGALIKISRFALYWIFEVLSFLGGFVWFWLTKIHSWGLVVLGVLLLATDAKEESVLIELVELFVVVEYSELVELVGLARAFALDSIWRVADSKLATWDAIIVEALWSRPFSVYSRKISRRSKSLDCSLTDLVNEQASKMRLLASIILALAGSRPGCWSWLVRGLVLGPWIGERTSGLFLIRLGPGGCENSASDAVKGSEDVGWKTNREVIG
jgi:hypothetical protein